MQPRLFPVNAQREQIQAAIVANQVTILVAETGTGKTTQVPIMLPEGMQIGITQTRRIAATSAAQYVADQQNYTLGGEVGYKVRFDDSTMPGTRVKYMTDGILLQEAIIDPLFRRYGVLIIDEVHERTLNTDFVLGLVALAIEHRPELKVVIMSATMDADKFSVMFGNAPILRIEGKMYPVAVSYLSQEDIEAAKEQFASLDRWGGRSPTGVEELAAYKVAQIHQYGAPGDILVFMPGKGEIYKTISLIERLGLKGVKILAVHGDMSLEEQRRIFEPFNGRRIIVATNVAETSLTIDGVVHVVDSGLIRQTDFDSRTGISSLHVVEHSKAGLEQRRGRGGRTQAGFCWRLFLEEEYDTCRAAYRRHYGEKRPEYTEPEIRRSDLAGVVLRMIGMGIYDVKHFRFVDQPEESAVDHALDTLRALGALDAEDKLTEEIGRRLLGLPVEPRLGRMILAAIDYGCVAEICTITAGLSAREIFVWPKDRQEQVEAGIKKGQLSDDRSDFLTLLNVVDQYLASGQDRRWARGHYVNARSLDEIINIREQLMELLEEAGISITTVGYKKPDDEITDEHKAQANAIGKATTAGLLQNLIKLNYRHGYTRIVSSRGFGFRDEMVYMHPGSVLFGQDPQLMICGSIVETTAKDKYGQTIPRIYGRSCMPVVVEWVQEVAPHLVTVTVTEPSYWSSTRTRYKVTKINGVEVGYEYLPIEEEQRRFNPPPSVNYASRMRVVDLRTRVNNLLVNLELTPLGDSATETLCSLKSQLDDWCNQLLEGGSEEAFAADMENVQSEVSKWEAVRTSIIERRRQELALQAARKRETLKAELAVLRTRIGVMTPNESWGIVVKKGETSPIAQMLSDIKYAEEELFYDSMLDSLEGTIASLLARVEQYEANHRVWEAEQLEAARLQEEEEEYQEWVRKFQNARWPGSGKYCFQIDSRGEPVAYQDRDGYLCEYDISASEELPEASKSYWGFVNQEVTERGRRIRKIGLLREVREKQAHVSLSIAKK